MTKRPDTTRDYDLVVDIKAATVTIPHWGITFRTLYGAVLSAWTDAQPDERKEFTVRYKGASIAVISVQQYDSIL